VYSRARVFLGLPKRLNQLLSIRWRVRTRLFFEGGLEERECSGHQSTSDDTMSEETRWLGVRKQPCLPWQGCFLLEERQCSGHQSTSDDRWVRKRDDSEWGNNRVCPDKVVFWRRIGGKTVLWTPEHVGWSMSEETRWLGVRKQSCLPWQGCFLREDWRKDSALDTRARRMIDEWGRKRDDSEWGNNRVCPCLHSTCTLEENNLNTVTLHTFNYTILCSGLPEHSTPLPRRHCFVSLSHPPPKPYVFWLPGASLRPFHLLAIPDYDQNSLNSCPVTKPINYHLQLKIITVYSSNNYLNVYLIRRVQHLRKQRRSALIVRSDWSTQDKNLNG